MKVAVIGGNGQLGTDVVRTFQEDGHEAVALSHENVDIANGDSVARVLKDLRPDAVVNTAAMHHVENCERDAERAFAVNGLGARNVAQVARDLGAAVVHISTDYVFDGERLTPYEESDCPQPLNVYGASKLAGECLVRCVTEKHFIVRTSALYGEAPCRAKGGRNFVELMLKLAKDGKEVRVVDSEWVTPTSTRELARQVLALCKTDAHGLYHATAEGSCSWYEFARTIFEAAGIDVNVTPVARNAFPTTVARPRYSVLENKALKQRGVNVFGQWQQGLYEYLGVSAVGAVSGAK